MASAAEVAEKAEREDIRSRWLLSAPALVIIFFAAVGPLLIVLVYSFLAPGRLWRREVEVLVRRLVQRLLRARHLRRHAVASPTRICRSSWRSVKLSLLTTLLTLFFGFPTAYFIATRPERSPRHLAVPDHHSVLDEPAHPHLRRSRRWCATKASSTRLLLWLGVINAPIQIMYTDTAILMGMLYVYLPLMVLPLYASMEKLDFRLVEAAYDLYATRFQVLRRVILPLVKPGIVAGSILVFIPSLGAYVTPRVLGGGKNMMLGNLIELQFGQGRNWPLGRRPGDDAAGHRDDRAARLCPAGAIGKPPSWLAAVISRYAGSRASRRSPALCFVMLYLPILTLVVCSPSTRASPSRSGKACRGAGSSRPGPTRRFRTCRSARCRSRLCRAILATIAATMAALATTRTQAVPRLKLQSTL